MGHKEAIVLILIFPHIVILILLEKRKELTCTQNTELKASLISHINIYIHAGIDGLAEPA